MGHDENAMNDSFFAPEEQRLPSLGYPTTNSIEPENFFNASGYGSVGPGLGDNYAASGG